MKLLKESAGTEQWSFDNNNLDGLAKMIGNNLYNMISSRYGEDYTVDDDEYIFTGDSCLVPGQADLAMWIEKDLREFTLDSLKDLKVFLKSNTDYLSFEILLSDPTKDDPNAYVNFDDLSEDTFNKIIDYYNAVEEDNVSPLLIVRYQLIENPFFL